LKIAEPTNIAGKRQSATERQTTIQTIKNSAAQALNEITEVIQHFDGRSLAEYPDPLGSLPIEITPLGITG
jgi:sorbitol-specific phosphotransferase system component IIA